MFKYGKIDALRPQFIVRGAVNAWIIANFHEIVMNIFIKSFHEFSLSKFVHRFSLIICHTFQNQLYDLDDYRVCLNWFHMNEGVIRIFGQLSPTKMLFKLRACK
jgi:hypothetical protein